MGLFNKLFNNSTQEQAHTELPWIQLTTVEQLQDVIEKSAVKPQVIFKHSTRCGISRMVKKQFEKDFDFSENELDLYYLDLLSYRDVSNNIQNTFNVQHQSPQLIIVKNKNVVAHASHGSINDLDLKGYL